MERLDKTFPNSVDDKRKANVATEKVFRINNSVDSEKNSLHEKNLAL